METEQVVNSENGGALQAGDHLRVPIGNCAWHHGVYMGEGQVAHWHDGREGKAVDADFWERKKEASIRVTTFDVFSAGRPVERTLDVATHPVPTILERARSRVGEKGYHLAENNCEHFVRWCRQGKHESQQVHQVENLVSWHGEMALRMAALAVLRKAAPGLLRAGLRGGPALTLTADLAGLATRKAVEKFAPDRPRLARTSSRWASGSCATLAGLGMAGPVGALAGIGMWAAGEMGSHVVKKTARRVFRAWG